MTTDARITLWETDLLAELAGQRHGLLEQLRTLGKRQLELIGEAEMTQLLHVLSAKHHLLAELQQVEKRLDPYRGQDPDLRTWRSAQAREQCAELVARSEQALREILEQERLGEARMREHRDAAAARLRIAHAAGHARTAYAKTAVPGRINLTTER
ncbi:MAG TPA: hypothetical protein VG826_12415 [Pirellulales bacterium]|nr:hypothetical protein [Pirellulales bacterium]